EAVKNEIENINLYPESSSRLLREKLAHKLKVDKEMIIVGNGEDDIIDLIGMAFINEADEVITGEITFPAYETVAKIMGGKLIVILLEYLQPLGDYRLLVYGLLLVIMISYYPQGLIGILREISGYFKKNRFQRN
ncbi:unnamed protein product, partial [marine sediment metagenome]